MRRSRKVKILATIGPASSDEAMLKKLFEAGADTFRINMSHTDHALMRTLVKRIRTVEQEVGRPIGILADLQGPKLRVGKFANGKETLEVGQTFTLDGDPTPGDSTRVYLPHPEILASVEPGHRLLIDDGKLRHVSVLPQPVQPGAGERGEPPACESEHDAAGTKSAVRTLR